MFLLWKIVFKKQIKHISNKLSQQFSIFFQIQIKYSSTSYICTSCLYNIDEDKQLLYQEPNRIWKTRIIKIDLKINTIRKTFCYVMFWFCSNL
jgi:hypothetical protein